MVAFSLAGEQLSVAARPNVYETLGGGQVEQDMARTWADCAATLRELGERIPNLANCVAAVGVTAQGDGSWLIDAAGEPVGGGLLWLDFPRSQPSVRLPRDRRLPRPLCSHWLRSQRVHGFGAIGVDEALAARTHRSRRHLLSLQGLAVFQADRRSRDRSVGGKFHLRHYRYREYEPSILEGMGIADCARLLPPMIDGVSETGKLTASAAAENFAAEGLPVSLAYYVVCTGLGGGLCDPVGDVGVSILGSTGMHMRYVPAPEDVRLNEDRSGYTMCLPIERACASMQSNLAATFNIDWLMDMAREAAEMAGTKTSRLALLSGLDDKVLATAPGQAVYHP